MGRKKAGHKHRPESNYNGIELLPQIEVNSALAWRVVLSGRFACSFYEVMNQWSMDDLAEALDILDVCSIMQERREREDRLERERQARRVRA